MSIAPGFIPEIGDAKINPRKAFPLPGFRPCLTRTAAGRRYETILSRRQGKYSRSKLSSGTVSDLAVDATLRAAAGRLVGRRGETLEIHPQDLREKIRRHRSPYLMVFVLDNSWSVHVDKTLEVTKGVVLSFLKDAKIHKDKVSLVAFRHSRKPDATVCLPPTSSYPRASGRLRTIPLTGSTPLPDAVLKAYRLIYQARIKYKNAIPVMVIVTDGLPNASIKVNGDPYTELRLLCRHLRKEGISTLVVDTESQGVDSARSACREMTALSGGRHLSLSELSAESIEMAVASILADGSSRNSCPENLPEKGLLHE